MEKVKERRDWHWELIISAFLMIGTILGIVLPLYLSNKADMDKQAARSDRLYEMFIDLLKENK